MKHRFQEPEVHPQINCLVKVPDDLPAGNNHPPEKERVRRDHRGIGIRHNEILATGVHDPIAIRQEIRGKNLCYGDICKEFVI